MSGKVVFSAGTKPSTSCDDCGRWPADRLVIKHERRVRVCSECAVRYLPEEPDE